MWMLLKATAIKWFLAYQNNNRRHYANIVYVTRWVEMINHYISRLSSQWTKIVNTVQKNANIAIPIPSCSRKIIDHDHTRIRTYWYWLFIGFDFSLLRIAEWHTIPASIIEGMNNGKSHGQEKENIQKKCCVCLLTPDTANILCT